MLNIETKVQVLSDGSYGRYVAYRRSLFFHNRDLVTLGHPTVEHSKDLDDSMVEVSLFSESELIECERLYSNARCRAKRLRKRIQQWSNWGFVYFVTLTFRDDSLENTESHIRRKYVSRFLKSLGVIYCANLDFGGKLGREHYHALICSQYPLQGEYKEHKGNTLFDCPSFDEWKEKRGFVYVQGPIKCSDDNGSVNPLKVAKYLSKTSNHALKETAIRQSMVFSRGGCPWKSYESLHDYNGGFFSVTDDQLADLPFDVND